MAGTCNSVRCLPTSALSRAEVTGTRRKPYARLHKPNTSTLYAAMLLIWKKLTRRDVRCGSRLCENSDLELSRRTFVSITLNKKRTALAGTVERRKERKQFCAFSARARFHTAWVKTGSIGASIAGLFYPQERTSSRRPSMSASCHSEPVEQDTGQKSRLEATASGRFPLKKLETFADELLPPVLSR
jgi:hypothetical protein